MKRYDADHDADFDLEDVEDFTAEDIPRLVDEYVTAKREAYDPELDEYLGGYGRSIEARLKQILADKEA